MNFFQIDRENYINTNVIDVYYLDEPNVIM